MVDEHACQPVADGSLHQRGGHRGVDPTGQAADRPPVADLVAHLLDERVGDVGRGPCRVDTGEFVKKPTEHLLSVRGVHHLGVILHARQLPGPVLERRHGRAGADGDHVEALWSSGHRVTMAHPHRLGAGQVAMKLSPSHFQLRATEFAGTGAGDRSAESQSHGLEAVADAEHRHPEIEDAGVQLRRAVVVDAGRSAGQHDGLRVAGLDLLHTGGVRDHLGVHPRLADPSRDQLRVLRSEVDHQYGTGGT